MPEPFLTGGALAKRLGIGRETVRQLTLKGVLTAYKPAGRRLYLESEAREAREAIKAKPHVPAEDRWAAAVAAGRKAMKQQQLSV